MSSEGSERFETISNAASIKSCEGTNTASSDLDPPYCLVPPTRSVRKISRVLTDAASAPGRSAENETEYAHGSFLPPAETPSAENFCGRYS